MKAKLEGGNTVVPGVPAMKMHIREFKKRGWTVLSHEGDTVVLKGDVVDEFNAAFINLKMNER